MNTFDDYIEDKRIAVEHVLEMGYDFENHSSITKEKVEQFYFTLLATNGGKLNTITWQRALEHFLEQFSKEPKKSQIEKLVDNKEEEGKEIETDDVP